MVPQPQVQPIESSIALVINMASAASGQTAAGAQFLAPMLSRLDLPATWVIDQPRQAKVLADQPLAELAVTVEARSPQRLRSELSNLQATVQAASGQSVSIVVGDPQQLRSRAALLADLGIGAVISATQQPGPTKPPRQLPCGLWQFDPSLSVPQPRSRWSWLTARRPSLQQLLSAETSGSFKVATIDLAQATDRDLQSCEPLLQEIAEAARQQQLQLATVSAMAAALASQREVKPQRSILRRAA